MFNPINYPFSKQTMCCLCPGTLEDCLISSLSDSRNEEWQCHSCMCVCIHIPFPLLCIVVVAVMREGMWADALVQERCCVGSSLWVSERPLVPRPCSSMDGFVNLLIYYCSLIIFFCHFQIFFKILLSLFFLSSAYCIRVKRNEVLKSLYCADKHVTHLCGIQVKTEIFKFCTLCNNFFFSR